MAYVGSTPAELFGTLNPNSVKTIDIQDDAVTADKIAAGAVAYADVTGTPTLATVATTGAYSDVTGTPTLATVATSGSYTDLTDKPTISATATNIAGGSAGTIPYQSAADTTAMLAVGTAGQVLQTNGAGAPTWVTPAGGAMVLLSTVTAATVATVNIETTFDGTYDSYMLIGSNITTTAGGGAPINCRFKIGSYLSSGTYLFHLNRSDSTSASYVGSSGATASSIEVTDAIGDTTVSSRAGYFTMFIRNPSNTVFHKQITWVGSHITQSGTLKYVSGSGSNSSSTGALTGIQFLHVGYGGNVMASGTYQLYGIVKS